MGSFVSPNEIRRDFSKAMSAMYQQEVPLYSDLLSLVHKVNATLLAAEPNIQAQLVATGELDRLDIERHGAIRLGLPEELAQIRRLFAVMGMLPVGYYDLVPSGVPVHATAFRAVDATDLNISPFRVFTSLLRLDLITDIDLRESAKQVLAKRQIFTPRVLELIEKYEQQQGLDEADAQEFIKEALETFRWHDTSPVSKELYDQLNSQHRLIADVVGFKGPHINHLTPRTLDIDAVQTGMKQLNIPAKDIIEGPPRRQCPILLRQTSFKALEESIKFSETPNSNHTTAAQVIGSHTARFGEIEQRGIALTPKGHDWYDAMLANARKTLGTAPNEANSETYMQILAQSFAAFPDDYIAMHQQELGYFYYIVTPKADYNNLSEQLNNKLVDKADINLLIDQGLVQLEPIVYEDFLPVSAAGIFQSNLGDNGQGNYQQSSNQALFEQALGSRVTDSDALYRDIQQQSLQLCIDALNNLLAKH